MFPSSSMLLTFALLLCSNFFTPMVVSQDTNLAKVTQAFIYANPQSTRTPSNAKFAISWVGTSSQNIFLIPVLSYPTRWPPGWIQPAPLAGTGKRRCVFLVFKQPKGFNDQTLVNSTSPYWSWNISVFGEAVGLGDPIAGTFMLVEHDPVLL
ncbi:hypothetical protein DFS33DRAFT_1276444 [Desarmillaria ectypa]|nr:hypothetical protein DFS33DRAFT_1276444 [Desarmillaria ectypa]